MGALAGLLDPKTEDSKDGTWRSPVAHLSRAAFNGRRQSYQPSRETSEDGRRPPQLHGVQGPQWSPTPGTKKYVAAKTGRGAAR